MTIHDLYSHAFTLFTARYPLRSIPPLLIRPGEGDGLIAEVRNKKIFLYDPDLPAELIVHILLHELGHIKSFEWQPKVEGDISPCLRIGYLIWSEWIAEHLARMVDGEEWTWGEEELTPGLVYRHLDEMPELGDALEEIGEGEVEPEALEEVGCVYLRERCCLAAFLAGNEGKSMV